MINKTIEPEQIRRERKTIRAMIALYCKAHHRGREGCCAECDELQRYAHSRISKCRFFFDKPTCAECPVHCYAKNMREHIRKVMRFSGPRMLTKHPLLALLHLADKARDKSRIREIEKTRADQGAAS